MPVDVFSSSSSTRAPEKYRLREAFPEGGMRRVLTALILFASAVSLHGEEEPRRAAARAVDRTVEWLRANPPEQDARLAVHGMDIWTWNLVSRLHSDRAVRAEAAARVRDGLRALGRPKAPDWIALSWWAVVLRCVDSQGLDTQPIADALLASGLDGPLEQSAPTTAWWSSQLLRHAGLEVESKRGRTAIADRFGKRGDYRPSIRDAYAFYHELAAAADFGRQPLSTFTSEQLAFVREVQPELMALAQKQADTDAVAELVIAGALLGQRDEPYFDAAIDWLLERQLDDGTYLRKEPAQGTSDTRHAVLVGTWALLVYLSDS